MSDFTEGLKRRYRLCIFVTEGTTYILQQYLDNIIKKNHTTLKKHMQDKSCRKDTCIIEKAESCKYDITKFDASILAKIILSSTDIPTDEKGLIYHIKSKRNNVAHPPYLSEIDEEEFEYEWSDIASCFNQLAKKINKDVCNEIQRMIKEYKMIDISKKRRFADMSDVLGHLQDLCSKHSDAEQNKKHIKEFAERLEGEQDRDYGYDVEFNLHLQMFDVKIQREMQELFVMIMKGVAPEAVSLEWMKLKSRIETLKMKLSSGGSNTLKGVTEKCISIQIDCPKLSGLLKLLRFVTSEAFDEIIQQLSNALCEITSKEVRITSCISEHSMKRLSAFIEGSQGIDVSENLDVCEVHEGEPIEYFCRIHDDVCCKMCRKTKHRDCSDVQLLREIKDIKDVDVTQVVTDLTGISDKINSTKMYFESELSQLWSAREQQQLNISTQKIELLEAVKNLERQQEECARHYNKLEQDKVEAINVEISSCETVLKDIQTLMTSLKTAKSKPATKFIAYKKCEKKIPESKLLVEEKQKRRDEIAIPVEELKYKIDTEAIEDTLHRLQEDLGQYKEPHHKTIMESDLDSKYKITGAKPKLPQRGKPEEHKLLFSQTESMKKVNISLKDDVGPSYVFGCCKTNEGDILVADNTNSRLKRIKVNEVIDFVDLSGHPWDVCATDKRTAVVAVFSDTLKFVSTRGKMSINKSIRLSHKCRSLAFEKVNQRLAILDHSNVYLYSSSGIKERVLYSHPSHGITLRSIAVSPSGKQYCISSSADDVIVIDNKGQQMIRTKLQDIVGGICYGPESNIYVCQKRSVVRLNSELKTNQEMEHGISGPLSLCFTDNDSELVVGQDNDTVIVLAV